MDRPLLPTRLSKGTRKDRAERIEQFCRAYVRLRVALSAALEVGYSPTGAGSIAHKLMQRPDVQRRIDGLQREQQRVAGAAVQVNRTWIMQRLVQVTERALTANRDRDAMKGLELIGKELGLFVDRKMDVQNPLDGLSADQ
jgi:hypothetical protein